MNQTFFELAAEHARNYRDRLANRTSAHAAPRVTIERAGGTLLTYPRCVLDEFREGYITITSYDSFDVVAEFKPGEWKEAKQFDPLGYVDMHCQSSVETDQPCQFCGGTARAWFVQTNPDGSRTYQCAKGHLVVTDPNAPVAA